MYTCYSWAAYNTYVGFESLLQVCHMLTFLATFHQHVVDVNLHVMADLVAEDFVNEAQTSGSHIL